MNFLGQGIPKLEHYKQTEKTLPRAAITGCNNITRTYVYLSMK